MPEAAPNLLYRLPVESYEAAARRLCVMRNLDADAFVRTDPHSELNMQPRWMLAADMLRTHDEMTRSLQEPAQQESKVILNG